MRSPRPERWIPPFAAAAALLLVASPAATAQAPDLAVTAAAKAPRSVVAGAPLKIRAAVTNRAGSRAGTSRVGLFLSTNSSWSSTDVELAGSGRTRALSARRRARVTVRARVPRDAPPAERFKLLACADARHAIAEGDEGNNCRAAGSLIVVGGSSFEVIDANVRLGRLQSSRALLYKLFAVFGDQRLPKRYRGDGSRVSGTGAVQEALERLPSLPAGIRRQVEPFLMPPGYRGSFAARGRASLETSQNPAPDFDGCTVLLSDWTSVETGNGKARVWWRTSSDDARDAQRLARVLGGDIWTSLTGVMTGHEPLPDGGKRCAGSDSKLDVWLWPTTHPGDALTRRFFASCAKPSPSYIVVHPWAATGVLAHEFMHVLQNTYSLAAECSKWRYVGDATATWAEDRADHPGQSEQVYPQLATSPSTSFGDGNPYAGWAFIYSATQHAGDAATVRRTYELGKTIADPLDALDAALPRGFESAWPAFAKDAWNRPLAPDAIRESFFSWDDWPVRPKVRPIRYRLKGRQRTEDLPIELAGLTRQYYDLRFDDRGAREVVFKDPSAVGVDPQLRTWAFVKIARRGWKAEDWTGRDKVEFCRDDRVEDVRQVVVVHSTSRRARSGAPGGTVTWSEKPKLRLRAHCDVQAILRMSGSDRFDATDNECSWSWAKANWQAVAEFQVPARLGRHLEFLDAIGGSGTGSVNGESFDCGETDSFARSLAWPGEDDFSLKITPVGSGGATVEVIQTPDMSGYQPYWLLDDSIVVERCRGPHGFIPEQKLGAANISVALSGNCDEKAIVGVATQHGVSSAAGTLEIRQAP